MFPGKKKHIHNRKRTSLKLAEIIPKNRFSLNILVPFLHIIN